MAKDVAWLQSDSQIIARAQKSPNAEGVLWTVEMPDGEGFGVALAKEDAASVSTFCNFVRNEWDERKEEQEAKNRRQVAERGDGPAREVEAAVPVYEAAVDLSAELRLRYDDAQQAYNELVKKERKLKVELNALRAAVEALDASEDGRTESAGVGVTLGGEQG